MTIALLGFGIEGKSAYAYLSRQYAGASFVVYDEKSQQPLDLPEGIGFHGNLKDFHGIQADLVIRTPSVAPARVSATGEITSVTKLFFDACPAQIIGVTGTKGKGTTASLIASILKAAGKTVHLVGNIGLAALDVLPDITTEDIVVYELSSYQLWDLEKSPQTAVVLMIEPDHLDVHANFDQYVLAKANIAKHQQATDRTIFYANNEYSCQIAATSSGSREAYPLETGLHVSDGYFVDGARQICEITALKLPGSFNLDNALAAIAAVRPWTEDGTVIATGLSAFTGLPHRLKFVAEKRGVRYYDDSIATTPGSALAAAGAFKQPKVLILGGISKGANFDQMAVELKGYELRSILLLGEEAGNIEQSLQRAGMTHYERLPEKITMAQIVTRASELAQPGDVVLLSPACSSLDMFKGYQDRGDQFITAVNSL